jgi:putative ATP-binding cassette transporter
MHEASPPKSATGAEFYDSVLSIADGVAIKHPLRPGLPAELTTILEQPVAVSRLGIPRLRRKDGTSQPIR